MRHQQLELVDTEEVADAPEAFPELVHFALERFTLPRIAEVLRELLDEEISIRDLRGILESLLSIDGTTDVDMNRYIVFTSYADNLCPDSAGRAVAELPTSQLANFVRTSFKRYISHKYTRGGNTLLVYLLDSRIEQRLAEIAQRPLSDEDRDRLLAAVRGEAGDQPPTANLPVLLTTFEVRRALRSVITGEFPRLAVVCYQELSPDMNIQPISRIGWD